MITKEFPLELDCRKQHGYWWELLAPFRYRQFLAPKGFWTNFVSVPRVARWYVARDGDCAKAAVIHDYLYDVVSALHHPEVTRRQADRVFLSALIDLNVRPTKAVVLYLAVRIGRWYPYRKPPKEC